MCLDSRHTTVLISKKKSIKWFHDFVPLVCMVISYSQPWIVIC